MGGLLDRLLGTSFNDQFVDKIIPIHGKPYRFVKRLGAGSFGAVYSARGPHGVPVAVKVVNINGMPMTSQRLIEVYLNEVSLLERLRQESQHVVRIYDFDFDPVTGLAYIVMELGGENLGKMIQNSRGPNSLPSLHPGLIRDIWRQMVSIIGTLHRNNIVHMDLKPDNLIFFGPVLKIADLGISRKADSSALSRVGTPFFSAPEIMKDQLGRRRYYSPKADIWSMGAILYYMIYGQPPNYTSFAANPPPNRDPYPDPLLNDILLNTLVQDPRRRIDIISLAQHPFNFT